MENNIEKKLQEPRQDNGVLWAILLTIGMVIVMAILKHYIG